MPAPASFIGSDCSATWPATSTFSPGPEPARAVATKCLDWAVVKLVASLVIVTLANATFPDFDTCAAPALE